MPPQVDSLADYFAAKLTVEVEQLDVRLNQVARFVIAYSGGVDSTVLLHLAHQYCTNANKSMVALHATMGCRYMRTNGCYIAKGCAKNFQYLLKYKP